MSSADFKLDARLRGVPVPDGLLDRLLRLPLAEDGDVDELVRDVAVPPGLLEWLQAIPLADDDGLDEALRNVPVPDDLVASCRHHARRQLARREGRNTMDQMVRISRIAMAVSLMLAVTLSLVSAMWLSWILNGSQVAETGKVGLPTPIPALAPQPLELSILAQDASPSDTAVEPRWPLPVTAEKREIELAQVDASGLPASLASVSMPSGVDPWQMWRALGFHNSWDEIPELPYRPTAPIPRGVDWPLEPPANRPFLVKWGFHPFVSPSASPRLQTCLVPLAIEPTSYELARRYLERNEWPPIDRDHSTVRTEEFLAAVDYNFPKPNNRSLDLIVAGGPSPISGEGFCLLQVGVQARQIDHAKHAPHHLVLLIDTSTSMRWGSRMEVVRRALRDLPGIVGAEDRLSLVTFNQAAHVLVENLSHGALTQFAAAADSLSAEGATNVVDGLREAYGVARPTLGAGRPAVRVVLLTDGLLDMETEVAEKLDEQAAQAAGQGIPLDVIDLGQDKTTNPQAASLAKNGRGEVRRAGSAEEVRWALREIVTGRSQLVASAARLQVTFNPKSVLEYRLVGHESSDWGGLLPGPLEADFRAGQAATALFEVRLAPNGPDDLASVNLTWYAPDGAKTLAGKTAQTARATVRRKDFASSLGRSAPWLQEAAVVAYMAEVLRHSPFIFQRSPRPSTPAALFRAVELCGQVESQLRKLPSFEEFATLVRQELRAHPAKRAVKE